MNLKILAIITARKNSRRLIKKNIKPLGRKPLVAWTIDFSKKLKKISDIMITTDDKKILKIARSKKIIAPWLRPKYLSGPTISSEKVIMHAVKWFEKNMYKLDGVLLLQPTTPFRSLSKVNRALKLFEVKKDKPIVSVSKKINNKNYENFKINGSFYLYSVKHMLKNKKKFVKSSYYLIKLNKRIECIDINNHDEFEYAKKLYNKMY